MLTRKKNIQFLFMSLAILILFSLFLPIAICQETSKIPEYTLDIPCFAPTKISFNYVYTHYHSLYDITTVGASLYKHTGGPTNLEFIAEDVDDYFFTLKLRYEQPVNQTIMVGIWSGTAPMQGLDYKSSFTEVIFHVRLRVTRQPTYPTEAEVAQAVVTQVQKNLEEYYRAMNDLIKNQNVTIITVTVLAIVAVGSSIVGSVITFSELRRFRQGR